MKLKLKDIFFHMWREKQNLIIIVKKFYRRGPEGTVSQYFRTFFWSKTIWALKGKNGSANFLVFADIFAKHLCHTPKHFFWRDFSFKAGVRHPKLPSPPPPWSVEKKTRAQLYLWRRQLASERARSYAAVACVQRQFVVPAEPPSSPPAVLIEPGAETVRQERIEKGEEG